MKILAVLFQLLLIAGSQCWFFERFLPHNDIATRWFNYKVSLIALVLKKILKESL